MPDSASSVATSRGRSRSRRSVEKTAAASVDDSTAPISTAVRQSSPADSGETAATTTTLTTTPTVASVERRPEHRAQRGSSAR